MASGGVGAKIVGRGGGGAGEFGLQSLSSGLVSAPVSGVTFAQSLRISVPAIPDLSLGTVIAPAFVL